MESVQTSFSGERVEENIYLFWQFWSVTFDYFPHDGYDDDDDQRSTKKIIH